MATLKTAENMSPVYIPWKSFENYIAGLKSTTIPHTLDGSVRPKTMSGGLWRQVISALRFIGVITQENVVTDGLESLVTAHGTEQWAQAVKEHVLPAYEAIIGELPIENATAGQLNARFKSVGSVDGQMLGKCVRFYIHALNQAGVKYSSHFAMRESSGNSATRARSKKKPKAVASNGGKSSDQDRGNSQKTPPPVVGMFDFNVPFGNVDGLIRVPRDIKTSQLPVFRAFVDAVEKMAEQNSGTKTE